MTQKDKELLLKDLCARLPYGVYVLVHDTFEYSTVPFESVYLKSSDISSLIDSISLNERYDSKDKRFNRIIKEHKDFLEFKPYLRPMSSMTDEEREEWTDLFLISVVTELEQYSDDEAEDIAPKLYANSHVKSLNWLNEHHFDYNGLIEKGLAIEVTKENNPYK